MQSVITVVYLALLPPAIGINPATVWTLAKILFQGPVIRTLAKYEGNLFLWKNYADV